MSAPLIDEIMENRYRQGMENYDFKAQRLFVTARLSDGATIEADRAQANYLLNVLRLGDGGKLYLFNGIDGEWLARVEPTGRKKCNLIPVSLARPQPKPSSLMYCFAPLKQARLDYMVQKAVEMGAGVLQPVITQHTQNARLNLDRARANAIEAAEQCGILSVPEIREAVKLDGLLDKWPEINPLIFCDEAAGNHDPAEQLKAMRGHKLAVLIGPEGGFSTEERKLLQSRPFVTAISLGPRILRADTAAVAALAVIQMVAGDWLNDNM